MYGNCFIIRALLILLELGIQYGRVDYSSLDIEFVNDATQIISPFACGFRTLCCCCCCCCCCRYSGAHFARSRCVRCRRLQSRCGTCCHLLRRAQYRRALRLGNGNFFCGLRHDHAPANRLRPAWSGRRSYCRRLPRHGCRLRRRFGLSVAREFAHLPLYLLQRIELRLVGLLLFGCGGSTLLLILLHGGDYRSCHQYY